MPKKCIQIYVDEGIRRRIELAAAKRNVSITSYCLAAIKQKLAEDDLLERDQIEIATTQRDEDDLIADLQALHAEILAYRGGQLLDINRGLEATRKARDDEIAGLC